MKQQRLDIGALESRLEQAGLEKINGRIEKVLQIVEERQANLIKILDWKAEREELDSAEKRMKNEISEVDARFVRYVDKEELHRKLQHIDR